VTAAESAQAARERADRPFDLYVFDLNLGRENGLQLLDELEAAKGPIAGMIVTGATTPDVLAQLEASGRSWVTKPISAARLTEAAAGLRR
jgi:DNA-binding response OmpR family regulator